MPGGNVAMPLAGESSAKLSKPSKTNPDDAARTLMLIYEDTIQTRRSSTRNNDVNLLSSDKLFDQLAAAVILDMTVLVCRITACVI